jgi:hypothetical protein
MDRETRLGTRFRDYRRNRGPDAVKIDFDAGVVDQMIERLPVLRAQMLPARPKPARRN